MKSDCNICGGPPEDHGILNGYHDKHAFEPKPARCMAAKFLRHIGDRPSDRIALYAHCDRVIHEDEAAHHFVDGYGTDRLMHDNDLPDPEYHVGDRVRFSDARVEREGIIRYFRWVDWAERPLAVIDIDPALRGPSSASMGLSIEQERIVGKV